MHLYFAYPQVFKRHQKDTEAEVYSVIISQKGEAQADIQEGTAAGGSDVFHTPFRQLFV